MTWPPSSGHGQAHRFEFGLRLAEFGQDAQCFGRLGLVDKAHGEADVDQNPIPHAGSYRVLVADNASDVDLALDAPDVDCGELPGDIVDFLDAAWDPEAHGAYPLVRPGLRLVVPPPSIRRAAPIAACPSARPPSLAGTRSC